MTFNVLPLIKGSIFKNKLRTLLTILSITLGVATIVSLQIAIQSTKKEFNKFVSENISNADLVVESMSESPVKIDLEDIKSMPEVSALFPQLKLTGITKLDDQDFWVNLLGVELNSEIESNGLTLSKGELPQRDELLLMERYAMMYNISLNDTLDISTERGTFKFKVSGFVTSTGIVRQYATSNYMMTAVISLSDAQKIYGSDHLSSVSIALKKNSDPLKEKDIIRKQLSDNVLVKLPEEKSEDLINKINGLFVGLNMFGFLALFIGCFLIYNTMTSIVLNSSKEVAILKAIGGDKRYIFSWILALSLFYGIVGSILGFGTGIGISKLVILLVEASGIGVNKISSFSIPWLKIAIMSLLGLAVSVISSLLPAVKASKITVIDGLLIKKFKSSFSAKKAAFILGIFMALGIVLYLLNSLNTNIKYIIFLIVLVIIYLSLLILINPLAKVFSSIVKKISPMSGNMITSNISNNIYRTGNTIFTLLLCVAMSVGFMGGIKSYKMSMVDWYHSRYNGEIALNNPLGFTDNDLTLIKNTKGVKNAYPFYVNLLRIFDSSVMVQGIDPKLSNIKFVGDDQEKVVEALKEKGTIALSTILKKKLSINLNDTVSIPTDTGIEELRVVGFVNTSRNNGYEVYVSSDNFKLFYPNVLSNELCVQIDKTFDTSMVIVNLKETVKNEYVNYVDMSKFLTSYENSLDDMFTIFYAIMTLGFVISLLVIINSMIINTNEMKYQISLLKSLGLTKRQMVYITANVGAVYGIASAVGGSILGIFINYSLIYLVKSLMGMELTFSIDSSSILVLSLISIVVAVTASVLTALYSYRVKITNVLRTGEI
ncbi:ABC transporter permease [Clostridium thermarum]|uniref:ABC transporter permease n=1 Tax=Clostridium thermarum TaxID=1716543 RepID=UPI0013D018CB|nr:ABC transporter permease [Clostridium thermarum]